MHKHAAASAKHLKLVLYNLASNLDDCKGWAFELAKLLKVKVNVTLAVKVLKQSHELLLTVVVLGLGA